MPTGSNGRTAPTTMNGTNGTQAVRAAELMELPQQIDDAFKKVQTKRKQVAMLGLRADPASMGDALKLHAEIEKEQTELTAMRHKLQELSKKEAKASKDKARGSQLQLSMEESTELVPLVSEENVPLPPAQVGHLKALADQLNNLPSFERAPRAAHGSNLSPRLAALSSPP